MRGGRKRREKQEGRRLRQRGQQERQHNLQQQRIQDTLEFKLSQKRKQSCQLKKRSLLNPYLRLKRKQLLRSQRQRSKKGPTARRDLR